MGYIPYNDTKGACVYTIIYYRTENGKEPVKDFIDCLDSKMKAKTFRQLELLENNGIDLREPHSKFIKDGIFELRVKFSSNISRIFYFFYVDNKIILTNGFIKKTVAIPKNELNKALKYRQDFERRDDNDHI